MQPESIGEGMDISSPLRHREYIDKSETNANPEPANNRERITSIMRKERGYQVI